MEELVFNCPAYVAQRFWLVCAKRNETPGSALRKFMTDELVKVDAGFKEELQRRTGREVE